MEYVRDAFEHPAIILMMRCKKELEVASAVPLIY